MQETASTIEARYVADLTSSEGWKIVVTAYKAAREERLERVMALAERLAMTDDEKSRRDLVDERAMIRAIDLLLSMPLYVREKVEG